MNRDIIDKLISKAKRASGNSYSPYSNFRVGAAVLFNDGSMYDGCNIESKSYGLTICAERVAIFKGVSDGKRQIKAVAIYSPDSSDYIYPCGACREVMSEFGDSIEVFVCNSSGEYKRFTINDLLPYSFHYEVG